MLFCPVCGHAQSDRLSSVIDSCTISAYFLEDIDFVKKTVMFVTVNPINESYLLCIFIDAPPTNLLF